MRPEQDIRRRVEELREEYDRQDPPTSATEDETEIALLRAIDELEWVLEEHEEIVELRH